LTRVNQAGLTRYSLGRLLVCPSPAFLALCVRRMEDCLKTEPTKQALMTFDTTWFSSVPLDSSSCQSSLIKGSMQDAGVVKLYEPSPTPCLYVADVQNMVARVPLIQSGRLLDPDNPSHVSLVLQILSKYMYILVYTRIFVDILSSLNSFSSHCFFFIFDSRIRARIFKHHKKSHKLGPTWAS
jgi:hypothetical protein